VLGLLALARRPAGDVVMLDTIAGEEGIPIQFLAKIFQTLSRHDMVRSVRGTGGGFLLARNPRETSVLEVIEAVEGRIALQRCLDEDVGCEHSGGCALCSLFSEAQHRVREVFSRTTLADLASRHIPAGRIRHAQARAGRDGWEGAATLRTAERSAGDPVDQTTCI